MILKNKGEGCYFGDTYYAVGDEVIATGESSYKGMIGIILQICDGEDKETDNDTPDIYCKFEEPKLKAHKEDAIYRLSKLWNGTIKLEDANVAQAVVAPSMIVPLRDYEGKDSIEKVYLLVEETCVDGDVSISFDVFSDKEEAHNHLEIELRADMEEGMLHSIQDPEDYEIEESADSYECYLKGFYTEWHYSIRIVEYNLNVSKGFIEAVGKRYIHQIFADDFEAQVEPWDEFADFTDREYAAFIHNPEIPNRIREELRSDENFMSEYIGAVCEIAHKIVDEEVKKREANK